MTKTKKNYRKKTTKNYRTKTTKNYKINIGGKVLASGGFGCVFDPALKCEGKQTREKGKISKLMTNRHAIEEYNEIKDIKTKLDSIPNYTNYFIIDNATLCKPAKLSESDLGAFKKCSSFKKDKKNNITKKNINSKLDDLMILNMPKGGLPVDDYIYKNGNFNKLYELNNSLILLLKNGIIPMNKHNVYHSDIKDSNVLVDKIDDQTNTKLIDWGLSTEYVPFKMDNFPDNWKNRPFQFNVPFSIIIFSDDFIIKYSRFIQDNSNPNLNDVKKFVKDFIDFWNKERGPGHYRFINEIFYYLYKDKLENILKEDRSYEIEIKYTMPTIINYISDIVMNFTKKSNINSDNDDNDAGNNTDNSVTFIKHKHKLQSIKKEMRDYLDNVFIKNIDIWGFINCYYPFIEMLSENYTKLNNTEKELLNKFNDLYINILYSASDKPINLSKLFTELNIIKQLLYKISNASHLLLSEKVSNNRANGLWTLKNKTNIFARKEKIKRFKNPFYLSSK
jgi:hypothetical protein